MLKIRKVSTIKCAGKHAKIAQICASTMCSKQRLFSKCLRCNKQNLQRGGNTAQFVSGALVPFPPVQA